MPSRAATEFPGKCRDVNAEGRRCDPRIAAGVTGARCEPSSCHADGTERLCRTPHDCFGSLAEHHDRPAVVVRDALELCVGVDGDWMPDGFHHRQVAGRIAVCVALAEIEVLHLASSVMASTLPGP